MTNRDLAALLLSETVVPAVGGTHELYCDNSKDMAANLRVSFDNGNTLSIVWHTAAYSNVGRGNWKPGESMTFEYAGIGPDGDWITEPDWMDSVRAYAEIPEIIAFGLRIGGAK